MSKKETALDELLEKVITAPADAFTALPDDDETLEQLLREFDAETPAELCQSIELAVASPLATSKSEAMPAHLRRRIELDAPQFVGDSRGASVTPIGSTQAKIEPVSTADGGSNWFGKAGWLVAATLLVALLVGRNDSVEPPAPTDEQVVEATPEVTTTPTSQLDLDSLLAMTDTISVPWTPPTQPGFERVTGAVVWNDALQQGFMRLSNMPTNDAAARQYQLWIVDPDRDAEPVDGGVFDIVAATGEVLVPIDAKLPVSEPTVFAITLEQRGGVVVSEGPLIVVAPVAS